MAEITMFLLNNECVLAEIAELAKLHISGLLELKPEAVTSEIGLAPGGKVIPTFNVNVSDAGPIERKYVEQAIAEVWLGWAKRELTERLIGIREVRRHGFEENTSSKSGEEIGGEKETSEKAPAE